MCLPISFSSLSQSFTLLKSRHYISKPILLELQSYITYRNTTIILKKLFKNIYPKGRRSRTFIQIVEFYEKFDFPWNFNLNEIKSSTNIPVIFAFTSILNFLDTIQRELIRQLNVKREFSIYSQLSFEPC